MAIGVLNPNDNAHSTATRPTATPSGAAARRWFSDGLNTEIRDHDFNAILGQIRHVIDHFGVPDVEGDDTLLRQAIQVGASALTGNILAFQALVPGTDKVPYWASGSTASLTTFIATSFSRGLLANANLASWQAALGIGTTPTFTSITMASPITMSGGVISSTTAPPTITIAARTDLTGYVGISGGTGAFTSARGAYIVAYGVDNVSNPGDLRLVAGVGGQITFNGVDMGPFATGTNAASLTGIVPATCMAPVQTEINTVMQNTGVGLDNSYAQYAGGGAVSSSRGAYLTVYGNNHTGTPGRALLVSGSAGYVQIQSGGVNIILDNVFTGVGTALTALNATNITSGTLAAARMAPIQTLLTDFRQTAIASEVTFNFNNSAAGAANVEARIDLSPGSALAGVRSAYVSAVNEGSNVIRLAFGASGATAAAAVERAYIKLGVVIGAPSGGDKGVGTLNAAIGVYDNGSLLTCVPLQRSFLDHGMVDLELWDKFAVNGRPHEAAHHFVKLLNEGVDPRDPMKFIAKMKELQALPGMPTMDDWQHNTFSIGEIFGRLWLAVEMLAVAWMSHIEAERETRH